jgi:hypothetical protein
MARALLLSMVTIALSATMSCAALADQYAGGSSAFAIYIAWTSDGSGHLQGQVQTASLAGAKVDRVSASFSGTRSGSEVSLVFPLLSNYSGQTWTGNFGFRSLTLQLPNSAEIGLSAGSFEDFRVRVASIERTASVTAAVAADADAHAQRIANAQHALENVNARWENARRQLVAAFTQLKLMFPTPPPDPTDRRLMRVKYAAAVDRMQSAWAHEQELAQRGSLTCFQKSQVDYAASQVSYAHSQLQYQDAEFSNFDQAGTSNLVAAHGAIDAMEQLYPEFKARYREYRQVVPSAPEPQLTQSVIVKTKRELLPLLDQFQSRLSNAREAARNADRSGDEIDAKATEFPKSLSCSG